MSEENGAKDVVSQKLTRFGRYLLLDHLVDGGMAKISRARILDDQATKIVAIKMIRPQYSQDPAFKKMFMDEIKVAFGLLHPNVVQTYDYGILEGQLYTAIEYVDGKNLKQFLERLKESKFIFPIEISVYIIAQVCQGLSYAHNFTDKLTNKPYNIIHRDISPHNIMITYDGSVKVIDFGIAKANTNSEETQAGTIKGKISYLAPEYLDGVELDHRYDQFAVGITLWEMLCSRKLFQADNELAILKKIQGCKVPIPSSINSKVPKELDQIVLKSLSKQRDQRYENMDQFNRALVKFLYSNYPDFNASDLNYFAKELFKDDISKDREKLAAYGKMDITPYIKEYKQEIEGKSQHGTERGTNGSVSSGAAAGVNGGDDESTLAKGEKTAQRRIVIDFGDEEAGENTGSESKKMTLDLKKKPGATGGAVAGGVGAAIGAAGARVSVVRPRGSAVGANSGGSSGSPSPHVSGDAAATAAATAADAVSPGGGGVVNTGNANVANAAGGNTAVDGKVLPNKELTSKGISRSTTRTAVKYPSQKGKGVAIGAVISEKNKKYYLVTAVITSVAFLLASVGIYYNFFAKSGEITSAKVEGGQRDISSVSKQGIGGGKIKNGDKDMVDSTKSPAAVKMRKITFTNANPYQHFYINNKEVNYEVFGIELETNTEIKVRVEQENMYPIFISMQITDDGPSSFSLPEPKMGTFGMLEVVGTFSSGATLTFSIDGNEIALALPIKGKKIPIGKYEGIVTNQATNASKKVVFEIKEDMVTRVE
ncbi:MAG: serine/threonine protein kinase [Oligoflexia bacterium]|nr:serine/threonine protein kinase [Oligoflexia bacterium]